jgi:hypothetical protein
MKNHPLKKLGQMIAHWTSYRITYGNPYKHGKGEIFPALDEALCHKETWGKWKYGSALVGGELSSSCSSSLPQESSHWYASDRSASVPQSQSECYGEEKNVLPLLEIKKRFSRHPAHSLDTTLTALSQLQNSYILGRNLQQWTRVIKILCFVKICIFPINLFKYITTFILWRGTQ